MIGRFVRLAPVTLALLASLSCGASKGGGGGETGGDESGGTTGEPTDPEVFGGMSARVEIRIDTRGIPHIYGETDTDVFFAAGYQVATDRLFQMDLLRRRALGRGAEVLGEGKVDEDRISRIFRFDRWGRLDAERLKTDAPEEYRLFVAWVAGVNRRIDEINAGTAPLPYGFGELGYKPEKWDNADPLVIGKMVSFGNSNVLEYEFLATVVSRLAPDVLEAIQLPRPGWATFTLPPEDRPSSDGGAPAPAQPGSASGQGAKDSSKVAGRKPMPANTAAELHRLIGALRGFHVAGSNNWAVDGRFTEGGSPLIANDPHQPLQSPSVMYALHMNSADAGGNFDVAGFGFAGVPGVQLGHNRKIQWAATTGFADCMDLYAVRVADDMKTISIGGKDVPVVWRDEVIAVAGGPSKTYTVGDVEGYGVLPGGALPLEQGLVVDVGRQLLVNWTGFKPTVEALAFVGMGRAQNIAEWEEAVELIEVGTFNWLAADASGISYHLNTDVPDRGTPNGREMPVRVVDGDDPGYVWTGAFLPPEKLPRSRAAETGFVVTANNDPFGFTADGVLSNDPWYYGAYYDPGYRSGRIEQRLKELTQTGGLTVDDMRAVQSDTHSMVADQLAPVLAEVFAKVETDPALAEFAGRPELATLTTLITETWNRRMERDQAGALAFHVWAHFLATRVFADDLGLVLGPVLDASPVYALKFTALAVTGVYPNADQVLQEGRDVLVLEALAQAAEWLTEEFGGVEPDRYTWADRHGTAFHNSYGGALDGGWHPTDGGEDTVNVSSSTFYAPDSTTQVRDRFESEDGAVFRAVTRFAADGTPEQFVNFPRGNSGDPDSPHFADTLSDWIEDKYTYYPYRRAEVEAATETVITLDP
jgi:penicillin amidase